MSVKTVNITGGAPALSADLYLPDLARGPVIDLTVEWFTRHLGVSRSVEQPLMGGSTP